MVTEETKYLATVTAPEFGVEPRVTERGGIASVTFGDNSHAATYGALVEQAQKSRSVYYRAYRSDYLYHGSNHHESRDVYHDYYGGTQPESRYAYAAHRPAETISLADLVNVNVELSAGFDWGFNVGAPRPLAPVAAPDRAALEREALTAALVAAERTERQTLAVDAEDLLGYTPLRKTALPGPEHGRLRRALARLEIAPLREASVNAYKNQMVAHYETHNKMQMPTWRLTELSEYALPVPEFVLRKAVAIKRELPEARFYVDALAVDPFLIVSLEAEERKDPAYNVASRKLDPETEAYIEVWAEPRFEEEL